MYDSFTEEAFRYARKSYGLRSHIFNSSHWIWSGGSWEYTLNPLGHDVRLGISQDWSFQHFIDNNLPRYMLLEPFVRNQSISISRGPLGAYPDVHEICDAIGVRCTQRTRPFYFANIKPDRPVGEFGPIWHPELTRIMRTKLLIQAAAAMAEESALAHMKKLNLVGKLARTRAKKQHHQSSTHQRLSSHTRSSSYQPEFMPFNPQMFTTKQRYLQKLKRSMRS